MFKDNAFINTYLFGSTCDDNLHTTTTAVAAYPSQVNQTSIQVEFSEDIRDGFFGYAVANLSWEAPPGICMIQGLVLFMPFNFVCSLKPTPLR